MNLTKAKEATYEAIWKEEQSNPKANISQLCVKRGVTVQAYSNWRRRVKHASRTSVRVAGSKEPEQDPIVQVPVPLSLIVEMYRESLPNLQIPRENVVVSLNSRDRERVALALLQLVEVAHAVKQRPKSANHEKEDQEESAELELTED